MPSVPKRQKREKREKENTLFYSVIKKYKNIFNSILKKHTHTHARSRVPTRKRERERFRPNRVGQPIKRESESSNEMRNK